MGIEKICWGAISVTGAIIAALFNLGVRNLAVETDRRSEKNLTAASIDSPQNHGRCAIHRLDPGHANGVGTTQECSLQCVPFSIFSIGMSISLSPLRRTTSECAKIILDHLATSGALGRKCLLDLGPLNKDELDRGLKYLREHGAIRHSALSTNIRAGLLYERTGVAIADGQGLAGTTWSHRRGQQADGNCFSGLLQAWNIRPPASKCGVRSVVRDDFSQEEQKDLQEMADRRKKFGPGRPKMAVNQRCPSR